MNDVRWDMVRSSTGKLLQIAAGKALKIANTEEKGLTLVDTEGMFLLLGIGFLVATGALVSEWVGGCTNKCIKLIKVKQEQKREEHRLEEEARVEDERIEAIRIDAERAEAERIIAEKLEEARLEAERRRNAQKLAKQALNSIISPVGILLTTEEKEEPVAEIIDERKSSIDEREVKSSMSSESSRESAQHSRTSSVSYQDLSPAMLTELYHGPQKKHSNIVMIDGKMMSENEALKYASSQKHHEEKLEQIDEISQSFQFLNHEEDGIKSEDGECDVTKEIHQVEINLQAPTPKEDIEEFFGEKVEDKVEEEKVSKVKKLRKHVK